MSRSTSTQPPHSPDSALEPEVLAALQAAEAEFAPSPQAQPAPALREAAAAALGLTGKPKRASEPPLREAAAAALGLTGQPVKSAGSSSSAAARGGRRLPVRTHEELERLAERYAGLSGEARAAARRRETFLILLELDALVITADTYARYCARMKSLGLEPYARPVLWHFNLAYVFGEQGLMARALSYYRPRPGQISLARHVADAMSTGQILMVEAGTGTGKTYSYLVPPLIAGRRVIVSTGTKALQDQLTSKDIPNLIKILGLPHHHHIALKGQSNYICRYLMEGRGMSQMLAREAQKIIRYVSKCADDIDTKRYEATFGELNFAVNDSTRAVISCDSSLCQEMSSSCPYAKLKWQLLKKCGASDDEAAGVKPKPGAGVESTTASVTGLKAPKTEGCPYNPDELPDISGEHCFIFAARHEAKKRQIVAINHALFFGALQSPNGFDHVSSILPWPDVLVFDEAHTLPEVGRNFFTRHVSLRELRDLPEVMSDAFKGTSVSVNSGAFQEVRFKYALLVRTLELGLSCYDADKRNVLDFKYRHSRYPSSFELLGSCLVHPRERGFLGEDSYLAKVLSALDNEESRHFFAHLGIEQSVLKGAAALEALGIKGVSALEDEAIAAGDASHLSSSELRTFEQGLQRRYRELIAPYQADSYQVGSYQSSWQRARQKECLVPPGDKPLEDVCRDSANNPVVEPLFRALMADLLKALRSLHDLFEANKEASDKVPSLIERSAELIDFISDFMTTDRNKKGELQWDYAAWVEISGGLEEKSGRKRDLSYTLVVAPIEIGKYLGPALRQLRDRGTTIIFASATITVNQEFTKFCRDIGLSLSEVTTDIVASPFDYAQHACLLTSARFPPVNDKQRITKCIAMVKDAIAAVDGGVFFLTTSYVMMKAAAAELEALFGRSRKVLVQGQAAVPRLMEEFREDGKAILVGTSSFWEGVDVPGKALSLVIIDKLPFKTIADPMQVARGELCAHRGGSYFNDISVPEAIIMLRQGVGRLIRNEEDSGALIILDPRLQTNRYSEIFFNSLPPMRQVTTIGELTTFLQQLKKAR